MHMFSSEAMSGSIGPLCVTDPNDLNNNGYLTSRTSRKTQLANIPGPVNRLSVIEQMMEDEARRLEKELRNEVRQHAIIDKHNQEQLIKEQNIKQKLAYREDRRKARSELLDGKKQYYHDKIQQKMQHSLALREQINLQFHDHQMMLVQQQLEFDHRMDEIEERRKFENSNKSEAWLRKLEDLSEKKIMIAAEDKMNGDRKLAEYHAKIAVATRKKAAEIDALVKAKQESLKKFERQAENKSIIDRNDAERRQEISENIREKLDQVETIQAIKQGILDQRRHRVRQAAALRGHIISLQKLTPGPSDYVTHETKPAFRLDVGKSVPHANDTDMISVEVKRKAFVPGPGSYKRVHLLNNGTTPWTNTAYAIPHAVKDTNALRKGVEDEPGPGHYFAPTYKDEEIVRLALSPKLKSSGSSPVMQAMSMANSLPPAIVNANIKGTRILPAALPGRVSSRTPSYLISAINLSKEVPGPGAYRTDPFIRKSNWLTTNKSLPILQKALHLKSKSNHVFTSSSNNQHVTGHTKVPPLSASPSPESLSLAPSPSKSPDAERQRSKNTLSGDHSNEDVTIEDGVYKTNKSKTKTTVFESTGDLLSSNAVIRSIGPDAEASDLTDGDWGVSTTLLEQ